MTPSQSMEGTLPPGGNGSLDFLPNCSQDEWRRRVCSLQQWVSELLIKNQQLRMTLMELQAAEEKGTERRND
jgi:hypothetical protein